jgi:hypothetical protein
LKSLSRREVVSQDEELRKPRQNLFPSLLMRKEGHEQNTPLFLLRHDISTRVALVVTSTSQTSGEKGQEGARAVSKSEGDGGMERVAHRAVAIVDVAG